MPNPALTARAHFFSPSRERSRVLSLLLFSLVVTIAGIGRRALWNPNEPVYGEGVREMIVRHSYYLPTVNGTIYSDKPILYFWAMLAGCAVTGGLTEAGLRLPSVLSGVGSILLVYLLGRRIFGIRAGFLAAAALGTMVMFWWHSQYVQMDQMLSFLILASLAFFFLARELATRRSGGLMIGSGAMMGLAFLTKGPVGLVVPAAVIGVYLLFLGEWRWALRKEVAWAIAAFLLLGAPWFVSLALTGHSDVLLDFFLRHNLERATDPFNHRQPFWYYLPRLLSDLFPWALFLPAALLAPVRNELERRGRLFGRIWIAVVFLLFSMVGSKRGVYLLPLYPAVALLTGKFWDEILEEGTATWRRRWARGGLGFLSAFLALAALGGGGVVGWSIRSGKYREDALWLLPLAAIALAGSLLVLRGIRRTGILYAVFALILSLSAAYAYAGAALFRRADRYKSPVSFCAEVNRRVGPADEIRSHGLWRWDSSYLFYTRRLMPQIKSPGEVESYLGRPERVFLLVESEDMDGFLSRLKSPVRVLVRQEIGHRTTALLTNAPGAAS